MAAHIVQDLEYIQRFVACGSGTTKCLCYTCLVGITMDSPIITEGCEVVSAVISNKEVRPTEVPANQTPAGLSIDWQNWRHCASNWCKVGANLFFIDNNWCQLLAPIIGAKIGSNFCR